MHRGHFQTVREVLERNISTIQNLVCYFTLEIDLSEKHEFIEEMKRIFDILKNRDKRIQFLMQIMEERFEKVWKLPWDLMKIIHSFTWNIDDLRDISSTVRILSLSPANEKEKTAEKRRN